MSLRWTSVTRTPGFIRNGSGSSCDSGKSISVAPSFISVVRVKISDLFMVMVSLYFCTLPVIVWPSLLSSKFLLVVPTVLPARRFKYADLRLTSPSVARVVHVCGASWSHPARVTLASPLCPPCVSLASPVRLPCVPRASRLRLSGVAFAPPVRRVCVSPASLASHLRLAYALCASGRRQGYFHLAPRSVALASRARRLPIGCASPWRLAPIGY